MPGKRLNRIRPTRKIVDIEQQTRKALAEAGFRDAVALSASPGRRPERKVQAWEEYLSKHRDSGYNVAEAEQFLENYRGEVTAAYAKAREAFDETVKQTGDTERTRNERIDAWTNYLKHYRRWGYKISEAERHLQDARKPQRPVRTSGGTDRREGTSPSGRTDRPPFHKKPKGSERFQRGAAKGASVGRSGTGGERRERPAFGKPRPQNERSADHKSGPRKPFGKPRKPGFGQRPGGPPKRFERTSGEHRSNPEFAGKEGGEAGKSARPLFKKKRFSGGQGPARSDPGARRPGGPGRASGGFTRPGGSRPSRPAGSRPFRPGSKPASGSGAPSRTGGGPSRPGGFGGKRFSSRNSAGPARKGGRPGGFSRPAGAKKARPIGKTFKRK